MAEIATFTWGPEGTTLSFRKWEDLLRYVDEEITTWQPLAGVTPDRDPANGGNRLVSALNTYRSQVERQRGEGIDLQTALQNIAAYTYPQGDGLVSDMDMGQRVLAVLRTHGPNAASFAYSFSRRWVAINTVGSIEQLQALMVYAQPQTEDVDQLASELRAERAKLKRQFREQVVTLDTALDERITAWGDMEVAARNRITSWIRGRALDWNRRRRTQHLAATEEVASLAATKAAFEEFMKLKAPADYWQIKAKGHAEAEGRLRWIVGIYFAVAIGALGTLFSLAGLEFLSAPDDLPMPVYFVISAGLATIAGLVFWIGRLLNRLYLSEHHLRKDAEERRVMMTTYLALTHDKAADEKDRHIILSALFRATSDGIVREDSAIETNLGSILSRVAMGRPA